MMKFEPSLDMICSDKYPVDLTSDRQAEIYLLKKLETSVIAFEKDTQGPFGIDKCTIYYQPYINNNNPDIIIHRPGCGVLIIEVKNINLDHYKEDSSGAWLVYSTVSKEWHKKKSPFEQVATYRDILFDFYLDSATEQIVRDKKVFSYISTAVYFHVANKENISRFKKPQHSLVFTQDNIENNPKYLSDMLYRAHLDKFSAYKTADLDKELTRILHPPEFIMKRVEEYNFNQNDIMNICESKPGMQKIRGFAGTGKTTLLAYRAVKAQLRTLKKVLFVCFNITFVNYIHDRISNFRHGTNSLWNQYEIVHFHLFIKQKMNRLQIWRKTDNEGENDVGNWIDLKQLESIEIPDGEKYAAIFVDEVQDFKYEWLRAIQLFLLPGGEMVIAGDENQNIYDIRMDENKLPKTPISGNWNKLRIQRRSENHLSQMAIDFFQKYLVNRYPQIEVELQRRLAEVEGSFEYANSYFDVIKYNDIIKRLNCHDKDVTILSNSIAALRKIDLEIRTKNNAKPSTMFENEETWEEIQKKHRGDPKRYINDIRRNKKFNFRPGNSLKIATIHSFKGASQKTVILLLVSKKESYADTESSELSHELVFTAITRASKNLFVYDPNRSYQEFFEKYV